VVTIKTDEQANATKALPLIYEGMNELVQEGLGTVQGPTWVLPTERVISAWEEGECVGVLTYTHNVSMRNYRVSLCYVEPSSRRQGVGKALLDELAKHAAHEKVAQVTTAVHVDNKVASSVLKHLGHRPMHTIFELDL
jgi:GNAT superfamily N-acetyltransferase